MATGEPIVGAGAAATVEASVGAASSADLDPQAATTAQRQRIPKVRALISQLLVQNLCHFPVWHGSDTCQLLSSIAAPGPFFLNDSMADIADDLLA